MKKRKLKSGVVYGLYAFAFITVLGTIYLLEMATTENKFSDDTTYVEETIIQEDRPVIKVTDSIIRPYTASNVTVARSFYDYQDTADNQANSLIYYEQTYMPNSGVDYKSEEIFDVNAILDGVVTNILEDNLLGNIVEVTYDNNLISVYQSLGEVNVSLNDQVVQGQVIGKSGSSNIDKNLGNHLHFEIIHNGCNVNPETYYDKKINEL